MVVPFGRPLPDRLDAMRLQPLDWSIIGFFFLFYLTVGFLVSRKAGASFSSYFLGDRKMPFWLLGISMVATTFSTDTPNLVTDIVRTNGVSGNWVWWSFLFTGLLTVFFYAKLWRRSNVLTDIEFYELRYSGKSASFLRAFRAAYLGIFYNVMIMGSVTLAAIKAEKSLAEIALVRMSRLSVMPLTQAAFEKILAMGKTKA